MANETKSEGFKLKGWHVVGLILSGLVTLVLVVAMYFLNTHNGAVRHENGIKAVDSDMQNVHGSITKQMRGQGISIEKYGEIVTNALRVGMEGRYGKTGSQAAFQWIQEQHPNIPPDIMAKLQQVIETGYNRFEATQRAKIDRVRVYDNYLGEQPRAFFLGMMGFPKMDMVAARRVISSAETKRDFAAGELSDPDPFGEKKPQ